MRYPVFSLLFIFFISVVLSIGSPKVVCSSAVVVAGVTRGIMELLCNLNKNNKNYSVNDSNYVQKALGESSLEARSQILEKYKFSYLNVLNSKRGVWRNSAIFSPAVDIDAGDKFSNEEIQQLNNFAYLIADIEKSVESKVSREDEINKTAMKKKTDFSIDDTYSLSKEQRQRQRQKKKQNQNQRIMRDKKKYQQLKAFEKIIPDGRKKPRVFNLIGSHLIRDKQQGVNDRVDAEREQETNINVARETKTFNDKLTRTKTNLIEQGARHQQKIHEFYVTRTQAQRNSGLDEAHFAASADGLAKDRELATLLNKQNQKIIASKAEVDRAHVELSDKTYEELCKGSWDIYKMEDLEGIQLKRTGECIDDVKKQLADDFLGSLPAVFGKGIRRQRGREQMAKKIQLKQEEKNKNRCRIGVVAPPAGVAPRVRDDHLRGAVARFMNKADNSPAQITAFKAMLNDDPAAAGGIGDLAGRLRGDDLLKVQAQIKEQEEDNDLMNGKFKARAWYK